MKVKLEPKKLKIQDVDKVYYCFNPDCRYSLVRSFDSSHKHKREVNCQSWIISDYEIAKIKYGQFNSQSINLLLFTSKPIQTQIILYYHKSRILQKLAKFAINLKLDVVKKIDNFENQIQNCVQQMFKESNIQDLWQIISNKQIDNPFKQICLKQILNPFSHWMDYRIPSFQQIQIIVQNLNLQLDDLLPIKNIKKQRLNLKQENVLRGKLKDNYLILNQTMIKKRKEYLQLKGHIDQFSTLSTVECLMGEPIQKFFNFDQISKQAILTCSYCDFGIISIHQNKNQSKKQSAKILLQHMITEHYKISYYNYQHKITKRAVRQLSVNQMKKLASQPHIKKVFVIDRTCSLYFQHILEQNCPSFAVQLLYFGEKSHSSCEFIKGGNSKEINLLLGMIIQIITVELGKKLIIYTNQIRKDIINNFCKYYNFSTVEVVVGKGKKQTKADTNKLQKK